MRSDNRYDPSQLDPSGAAEAAAAGAPETVFRSVLRADLTFSDVEQALNRLGFRLANVVGASSAFPPQAIFTDPRRATFVHLVEPPAAGADRWVLLRGPHAAATAAALDMRPAPADPGAA